MKFNVMTGEQMKPPLRAILHKDVCQCPDGRGRGFGRLMTQHLARRGMLDGGLKIRSMTLPGRLVDRNSQPTQYGEAGLDAPHIVGMAPVALGNAVTSSKPSLARTN